MGTSERQLLCARLRSACVIANVENGYRWWFCGVPSDVRTPHRTKSLALSFDLGEHSLDPRLCDRHHLQLVRETLGTCGWQSGGFSILASSSISSNVSLRYAFLLSTSVNDSSIVLRFSLVSLVSRISTRFCSRILHQRVQSS